MPQVSKRTLHRLIEERMFLIFFKSLAKLSSPNDIKLFLSDLLSPVEQTMLAKRLAIALLLAKGYSYESIKDILKVSQETISRVNMSVQYAGKGYNMVIKNAFRDEKIESFFEKIEDKTIAILPPSSIRKVLIHERKIKRKPKTSLG